MSANSATHRLGREIAVAIALKVAALALLYVLFFPPSQRPHMSPAAVAEKLFARDRG
ncbi:cytochrome oxidase putative small subunit CydP [Methylosinus sp. RM1]|uniref:cytochrome oxidase putative small subunit CydP n=1 Tax=Methylosinus sp. RM1 TaxID=2583817 RepID=UPI00140A98EE|nr:cytochrome oxidase putative small subunit CydP [Methylosinus sp. RM1]